MTVPVPMTRSQCHVAALQIRPTPSLARGPTTSRRSPATLENALNTAAPPGTSSPSRLAPTPGGTTGAGTRSGRVAACSGNTLMILNFPGPVLESCYIIYKQSIQAGRQALGQQQWGCMRPNSAWCLQLPAACSTGVPCSGFPTWPPARGCGRRAAPPDSNSYTTIPPKSRGPGLQTAGFSR